jgi:hypothetical protein
MDESRLGDYFDLVDDDGTSHRESILFEVRNLHLKPWVFWIVLGGHRQEIDQSVSGFLANDNSQSPEIARFSLRLLISHIHSFIISPQLPNTQIVDMFFLAINLLFPLIPLVELLGSLFHAIFLGKV